jgi:uncharacterized protein (DUF1800 family)
MTRVRAIRPAATILMTLLMAAEIFAPWVAAAAPPRASTDEIRRATHALNRLAFGPRPGEAERVAAMGVDRWIEQQLEPQTIPDTAVQARLAPLKVLAMSPRELAETFPPPQVLKAMSEGRTAMPRDPVKRAIYESALENYRRRQAAGTKDEAGPAEAMEPGEMMTRGAAPGPEQRQAARRTLDALLDQPAEQRFDALLRMAAGERRALLTSLGPGQRERLTAGLSVEQRETLLALVRPQGVVAGELMHAKLVRAIYSERQLEEVLTDFWFNHFNVFFNKGADRYLTAAYERDAIRPHVLGKFEDLLLATATHPAMLFYLDNWQSVGPDSMAGKFSGLRGRRRQAMRAGDEDAPPPAPRGLNENYARELMELHTLGVDGGYTQKDVQEVAKVFSGWTIRQPRLGGEFEFDARRHQPGTKTVLGQKIREDGMNEGRAVLKMLARHPSTARFLSRKLAMRFVADDPPPALVERMAEAYTRSGGDIRQVLRVMFRSPEFWADETYRAKVKTPLEFVASAARATGAEMQQAAALIQALQTMGMPLYQMQPPTGYAMKAEAWVNSAALLERMNFALALGSNQLRGVTLDAASLLPDRVRGDDADAATAALADRLVGGDVSAATLATIRKQLNGSKDGRADAGQIAGLLLGSPEFQRR